MQRKYVLDLLNETRMMQCRAAATPIDQNYRITAESGELVEKENYQKLVGRLLYLCNTRPDITYAVSIASRYMHAPRTRHLDAVHRILRYLIPKASFGVRGLTCLAEFYMECFG
jgi:hypothetical protein